MACQARQEEYRFIMPDELPASEINTHESVEAGIAVRSVARADNSGLGSIQTEVHSSLDANRRLVFVRPVKHDAIDKDSCFGIGMCAGRR